MSMHHALRLAAGFVLAAAAFVAAAPPPNVLIVSIDSLRRDTVGSYGARLPHAPGLSPTPNLDRLAAGGVRMVDAHAGSPWTLPSHVSLLTGQQTLVHQVDTDLQTIDPRFPTLATTLHERGYRSAGVFSGPYLEPYWGFGRGFDRYRAGYGDAVAQASHDLGAIDEQIRDATDRHDDAAAQRLGSERRTLYEKVRAVSHGDVSSDRVTTMALEDLDALAAKPDPWFLFVHYFDVHYDYVPPPPWDARFDPSYAGSISGKGFFQNPAIAIQDATVIDRFERRVSDRDLEHLRALYAGEAGWVDEHVGRLLAALAARGLDRRTLVVVVSDHGEEFFEHAGIGHRRTVFQEMLEIPMLLRLPGALPAGRAVRGLVSLADVTPTVLDLLGVAPAAPLGGRSMVPLIRGLEDPGERSVFGRLVRFYEVKVNLSPSRAMPIRLATVREAFHTGDLKVIRSRSWPLLPSKVSPTDRAALRASVHAEFRNEDLAWIDLARNPSEPRDAFSSDFSDPRARAALDAFRVRYNDLRAHAETVTPPEAVDPRLRSALEGLGYVAPAGTPVMTPRRGFILPPPGAPAPR